ncbi:SDR family NAD(P)-dependent oxidoreductase [Terribacillus saccharophilus]|uniref:SDR family NAD(P)-dependent oxidoreductase n=1 Tax=Terribacillus saccharophilus TaxID=361277 RepID=UPI003981D69C
MEARKKSMLITGASSGLGRELAAKAASAGYHLLLVARSEDKLKQIAAELKGRFQTDSTLYVADLNNPEEWRTVLQRIVTENQQINVLINNAGVGYFRLFTDTEPMQIETTMRVNVLAAMEASAAILPGMLQQGTGHVIMIGSMAGKVATPKAAVYGASKHSIIGFSNGLRQEMKPYGIQVTTVNLGPMDTNFFDTADPSGRYREASARYMLQPDRVARKVISSIGKNKREINLPSWMGIGSKMYQLMPGVAEKLLGGQFNKK